MHVDQMRKVVFKYRPKLETIYKKNRKRSIVDYANDIYVKKKSTDEIVSSAITQVVGEIFGTEITENIKKSLQKNNYVSTVDHHGLLCHPSFFQPDLLRTVLDKKAGISTTIVLSCASVSLNNHSFPRGLYFHKDNEQIHLPIFGGRYRKVCVYGQRSFSRKEAEEFLSQREISEELYDIVAPIFLDENLYNLKNYRSQIALINYRLMKIVGLDGGDFISVAIEDVVREILLSHHFKNNTSIARILFDEKTRDIFLRETNGIQSSHDFANKHTTVLFWGVSFDNERVPLRVENGMLMNESKNLQIIFDEEHIRKSLLEERIFPNLALCLITLSYHGMALGGGFSQVDYLPELVKKTQEVFSRIGEKIHLWGDTHFMGGDFMYLPKHFSKDITLVDVLNTPVQETDFNHAIATTTVSLAIDNVIPDVYKIIVAKLKKKTTCPHCGNNPTSHRISWISSAFSTEVNPFIQIFFRTFVGRVLFRFAEWILNRLCDVLIFCRVIKFDAAPGSAVTSRGRVLFDEALARGWKMETAVIFGKAIDTYRVTFPNGKTLLFNGLPRPDIDESTAVGWIDDKALLKKSLHRGGISVSIGGSFSNLEKAKQHFIRSKNPMIVKPRFGSRGRHTTTNLTKLEDFERAFMIAKQLGHFVIVEEHLLGSVYRATVIDGVLVGVLAGDPPRIVGDSVKTIRELIEIKNKNRDKRVSEVIVSEILISFLARQDYALSDILDAGIVIDLSEKIGLSYGGKSKEVTGEVHPKLRSELERAARVLNDPVLGFDFITQDVSSDPDSVRFGIIECNTIPFINLHHDPLEGTPINVAGKLWDYVARKYKIE